MSFSMALAICLGAFSSRLAAQQSTWAASAPNAVLKAPAMLSASDGIYEDYVLIRWDDAEGASRYKVFRTTDPRGKGLQELSPDWKKSNWLCDYGALPGVDYYYAVAASNGQTTSALSGFDKGYLKKKIPIANEEGLLSSNEAMAAPPRIFLLLSGLSVDAQAYAAGSAMLVALNLQNIHSQTAPLTEIRYLLSSDTRLDWDDRLLQKRTYVDFPSNASHLLHEQLRLPADLLPGEYYLIAVASPEGEIIASKTAVTQIVIKE